VQTAVRDFRVIAVFLLKDGSYTVAI
jgi:hypothetical protein